jgi:hypothetical protein
MNRPGISHRLSIIYLAVALLLPVSAQAATYYTARLDGPTAGTNSPATGSAVLILNAEESEITYTITYGGLLGTETVARIYNAPPGVIGPVIHDLASGSVKTGTWSVGPVEVAELNAGRVYILIRTDPYFGGEIRGDVTLDVVGSVADLRDEEGGVVPRVLDLQDNYPNPFNPTTTIGFGLPQQERVVLEIFDIKGRLISRLVNETRPAGFYSVVWNGTDDAGTPVASGVYYYRLAAGDLTRAKQMVLLK